MFAIYCEGHRGHVLLSTNNITAIQELAEGLKLKFVCICGHKGEWVVERQEESDEEPDPAKSLDGAEPLPPGRHAGAHQEWLGLIKK
jgi:hypothetical protein